MRKPWLPTLIAAALTIAGPALADNRVGAEAETAALTTGRTAFGAPTALTDADVDRYRRLFELQEDGHWKQADRIIARLEDRLLLGHVLAQRYLHPTKYRSRYKELKAWMAKYADHPDARRIYKLALRRKPAKWRSPRPPDRIPAPTGVSKARAEPADPAARGRSHAVRHRVAALKRQMRWHLRKGWTKAVKKTLRTEEVQRLFTATETDEYKTRLGFGYFVAGRDEWALKWAGEAAARSGARVPEAPWTAGLAAWRLGRYAVAADHFEAVARVEDTSQWLTSAGAFWAARAHLVGGRPRRVNALLRDAAAYPRTFYGLLARRMLGLSTAFKWRPPPLEEAAMRALEAAPAGLRAVALLQVDENERAERELKTLALGAGTELGRGILALAALGGMPALAVRLDERLYPSGGGFDGAAYPLPVWTPRNGFRVDRALIYAVIRQESRFNPRARSYAGARGLMQLMPGTASFVARSRKYRRGQGPKALYEPGLNLELGQKYMELLLAESDINGDLFMLTTAWNGGPGNLRKWRRTVDHLGDSLFFIESLPSRETRIFIERVLTNLWIYRDRLGQPSPSLDALAAGRWPVYAALDKAPVKGTRDGKN